MKNAKLNEEHQTQRRTPNSPNAREIAMPKHTYRWRRVSVNDSDVYIPWNMPIEASARTFAFGQPERGDKAIAPSAESERAGNGNSDRDGDGDGKDGTTSSGHVDSGRVEEALLAGDSQYKCQGQRKRNGHLPVSSRPPTNPADRLYGPARWRHRRGRLKVEAIMVKTAREVKTTYRGCACAAQPP